MAREIVVIGTSAEGEHALAAVLGSLSADFGLAVVVVQHHIRGQENGVLERLRKKCKLPIVEVEDKDPIEPGCVYFAPPDYHVLVDGHRFALSIEAPVLAARPAIDVLFETAADSFRARAIGVVLEGSNSDGALGLAAIRKKGGYGIIQDPATAKHSLMPEAALREAGVDQVLQLSEIGLNLERMWRDGR